MPCTTYLKVAFKGLSGVRICIYKNVYIVSQLKRSKDQRIKDARCSVLIYIVQLHCLLTIKFMVNLNIDFQVQNLQVIQKSQKARIVYMCRLPYAFLLFHSSVQSTRIKECYQMLLGAHSAR